MAEPGGEEGGMGGRATGGLCANVPGVRGDHSCRKSRHLVLELSG